MPPEYFQRLGVPPPPDQGDYFISWDKYFAANRNDPPDDLLELFPDDERDWKQQWQDRVDRATKWPWRSKELVDLAGWLKANEKPLSLMVEAGRRPRYYNPLVSTSGDPTAARLIGSLLPSTQKCREVARALACRAMARAGDGDPEGAWQDLLACQRLGRLLSRGGSLIEDLVGIAIVAIATNAQVTLVGHGPHPSERLRRWLTDLRALPPMAPLADKMGLTERFMTLDALQSVARNGPEVMSGLMNGGGSAKAPNSPLLNRMLSRSIDFDPAFRNANHMFDRCEAACGLPDRAARKQAFSEIEAEITQRKVAVASIGPVERLTMGRATRGEYIGDILIGLLLPTLGKLLDASDRTEQIEANLQVAVALAAYRADQGRYPGRLDELAPKYLPVVPGDLFSGKPLVYRPTADGYLFYSVGVNGLDEEGRWTDDEPKGDDLRVRMPVEAPRPKDPGFGR